jgi:proline dehydrogenase
VASLLDRAIVGLLPMVPKPIVGRFSRPYIAGAAVEDAVRVVRELNSRGAMATLDVLGEHINASQEADRALESYLALLETIRQEKLDSNVSVKLTQLGLKLDLEKCYGRIEQVVDRAADTANFVRLDMEDSSCTDDTLAIYRRLNDRHRNVGIVLQAMLRRSASDIEQHSSLRPNVRLCKGIYVEPRAIAYRDREIIRSSYRELLDMLFSSGSYVGIATHDELLVFEALALIRKHRLDRSAYEFQMLLGVDEALREILIKSGHRLRVYVPFGDHWYAYSVRRLKENPHMAGTIARATLRRLGSR